MVSLRSISGQQAVGCDEKMSANEVISTSTKEAAGSR